MNDKILDEIETHKGDRTCPNCGHQFALRRLLRLYIMGYGQSKWACPNCGELIKYDFVSIQIIWLLGLLFTGVLFGLINSYFDLGLFNLIFVVLYFGFALWILSEAKFERSE